MAKDRTQQRTEWVLEVRSGISNTSTMWVDKSGTNLYVKGDVYAVCSAQFKPQRAIQGQAACHDQSGAKSLRNIPAIKCDGSTRAVAIYKRAVSKLVKTLFISTNTITMERIYWFQCAPKTMAHRVPDMVCEDGTRSYRTNTRPFRFGKLNDHALGIQEDSRRRHCSWKP